MKSVILLWVSGSCLVGSLAGCKSAATPKNDSGSGTPDRTETRSLSKGEHDRYLIDAAASRFSARVGVGGALSMFGHEHTILIQKFSGEIRMSPAAMEQGSLWMTIQVDSLAEAGKEFSEADRSKINHDLQHKALEVTRYGQILFNSTSVSARKIGEGEYQLEITGDLMLHGITRSVTLPTRMTLRGNLLTARGEFSVRHSDHKIERLSAAGGTVK